MMVYMVIATDISEKFYEELRSRNSDIEMLLRLPSPVRMIDVQKAILDENGRLP